MERYKVGIVGFGVVGSAIGFGFAPYHDIAFHDPNIDGSVTLKEIADTSDYIFVAVPTPQGASGDPDDTILNGVLAELDTWTPQGVVAIKSTATPIQLKKYVDAFESLRIVFNPEFLTERIAKMDFINQTRIILGGAPDDTGEMEELYKTRFPHLPVFHTDIGTAALVKYMCNSFFAVKVSYLNEFYMLHKAMCVDSEWQDVISMWLGDCRIGNSHTDVPGPDGQMGWGGKCFPKDTAAAIAFAETLGEQLRTLEAARETNLDVRGPEDTWED